MTHLGKLLWESRFKNKITSEVIARGLGYRNISKGTRKYLRWERAETYPTKEELDQLIQVMKLNRQKVQRAVEQDERNYQKYLNEPVPMTLVVRLMPAVYADVKVPENLSPEEAEKWAGEYARKANLRVCLVKSRKESLHFSADGKPQFVIPERPHMMIGGRRFGFRLSGNSETITLHSPKPDHPLSKR